jgi:hypothetical protein
MSNLRVSDGPAISNFMGGFVASMIPAAHHQQVLVFIISEVWQKLLHLI